MSLKDVKATIEYIHKTNYFHFIIYLQSTFQECKLSRSMSKCKLYHKKTNKCIGENKGTVDQLCSISVFVFPTQHNSTFASILKFELLACFCDCTGRFVLDLVRLLVFSCKCSYESFVIKICLAPSDLQKFAKKLIILDVICAAK